MLPADLIDLILKYRNSRYIFAIWEGYSRLPYNGVYARVWTQCPVRIYIRRHIDKKIHSILWKTTYNGEKYLYIIDHFEDGQKDNGKDTIMNKISKKYGFKNMSVGYRIDILLTNNLITNFSQFKYNYEEKCLSTQDGHDITKINEIDGLMYFAKITADTPYD